MEKKIEGKGKSLYVCKAQTKEERQQQLKNEHERRKIENIQKYQGLNLYVKHLDDSIDDIKLKQLFSKFGKITSAVVMRDNTTKASKGFGFVCFSTPEEATRALTEMNAKIIGSKPLYVSLAQRKEIRRQELEIQYSQRQNSLRTGIQHLQNQNLYQTQLFYQQPNVVQQRSGLIYSNVKPRWTQTGNSKQNYDGSKSSQNSKRRNQNQKGDIKYNENVRNRQQPNKQKVSQQGKGMLNSTSLSSLSPRSQKQTLGESLFPLVQQQHPQLASKITGMLLEMDNGDILHLLENHDALNAKIQEAISVLRVHSEKNDDNKNIQGGN